MNQQVVGRLHELILDLWERVEYGEIRTNTSATPRPNEQSGLEIIRSQPSSFCRLGGRS